MCSCIDRNLESFAFAMLGFVPKTSAARVDLVVPSMIKPGQPLVVPDVGKHRLHRAKALAVELAPLGWINRL